ncbi:hypothetical protein ACFQO7_07560 [Catellatospora aurea]|uniref:Uncharacterized protein n=1 Tax=Catellatospora aurea TaxID=1337874 RepID=A0ABW2GRX7_9ACTN
MRTSYIEPITDKRAAFLYKELHRHRNRKRTGRCRVCSHADCSAARQATAELAMAGRDATQPHARHWRIVRQLRRRR